MEENKKEDIKKDDNKKKIETAVIIGVALLSYSVGHSVGFKNGRAKGLIVGYEKIVGKFVEAIGENII